MYWSWDLFEEAWNKGFSDLMNQVEKFATADVSSNYIDDEGNTRHDEEKQNTFAKIENGKFFIKVGLDNRAYNPIGLFSIISPLLNSPQV